MGIQKKTIICGALIFIMFLSLFSGCSAKSSHSLEIDSLKFAKQEAGDTAVISATELKSIINSGVITLSDDSCASILWVPKTQKTVLSEVTSFLKQAKLYKGKIPQSQTSGAVNANIGPSVLYISTSDKHKITIQPEFYISSADCQSFKVRYIADVLKFNNDGQESYIQSSQLYNWLKNDKWKTEFNMKQ